MRFRPAPPRFRKRSDLVSLAVVTLHLGFVLAPAFLAALSPLGPQLLLYWLWLGVAMNGLLNLMHECAHYHVFGQRWGSNLLGHWVLGPLFIADFDGYRRRHWGHHRNLGLPNDTKYTYKVDFRGWHLLSLLVRCLFVIEALKKFRHQTVPESTSASTSSPRFWLIRTCIVQSLLFVSLLAVAMASHHGDRYRGLVAALLAYCGVYLYGMTSLTVFVSTLRAIAEHQPGNDDAVEVGEAVLRNFDCGPFSRLIFGAYGFSEHATHHEEPAIPCYHLRKATACLSALDPSLAPRGSYLGTLLTLFRQDDGAHYEERSKPARTNPPVPTAPGRSSMGSLLESINRKDSP
jgi:fatty acid desaturase